MTTLEETAKSVAITRPAPAQAKARKAQRGVPLLKPRPGGVAKGFSALVPTETPVASFLLSVLVGFVALASLSIAAGLALNAILGAAPGFAAWDESVNDQLAAHRSSTLEHASWIASTLAGGVVIPAVIGLFLVVFLALRHWRLAAFVLFVVAVESATYRVTTLVVHRDRPTVHRLESLPVDASFPSGHTAASLALYGGLALLLASWARTRATWLLAAVVVALVPAFVAWGRMYRGMHHLTDSLAGVLIGIGALCLTVFAARVAGATVERGDGAGKRS